MKPTSANIKTSHNIQKIIAMLEHETDYKMKRTKLNFYNGVKMQYHLCLHRSTDFFRTKTGFCWGPLISFIPQGISCSLSWKLLFLIGFMPTIINSLLQEYLHDLPFKSIVNTTVVKS